MEKITPTTEAQALRDDEPTADEIAAMLEEAANFRQPAPPPTPVRARFYLTECEHCGWVGSSEHLGVYEDDISCPVCCRGICGDEPDEADTAKHGEAVYQRIVTAEAERDALSAEVEALRARVERSEARATGLADALQASDYLLTLYRRLHSGKPVKDLAEAEAWLRSARAALAQPEQEGETRPSALAQKDPAHG